MIATRKGLSGMRGLMGRNMRGLGAEVIHGVTLATCNTGTVEGDYACSRRNQDLVQQSYGEAPGLFVDQTNPAGWMSWLGPFKTYEERLAMAAAVPQTAAGAAQLQQQINSQVALSLFRPGASTSGSSTPSSYTPRVSFSSSRGGSTLYVGDSWTITITGAAPGAEIKVTGGKNGASPTVSMGSADGSGKFVLTGTVTSEEIGTWSESWAAGGLNAGSFSFTVTSGPGGSTSTGTGQSNTPVPTNSTVVVGGSSWFTGEMISGVPNWMLLAGGAVGAYFVLGGKH